MESIFRPNKWFVWFCALLIVVWVGLQTVSNMRLVDEAKRIGQHIFTWSWSGPNWTSQAEITEATVVKRGDADAIVKIRGRQTLTYKQGKMLAKKEEKTADVVEATLTFYRANNNWILGKVEF